MQLFYYWCYFLLSPNQETSSSEQSSDEDDKENKSVRAESIQHQGTSQNVKRIEVMQINVYSTKFVTKTSWQKWENFIIIISNWYNNLFILLIFFTVY